MRNSPRRLEPDYGRELLDLVVTEDADHPIRATLQATSQGCEKGVPALNETIRARYVVGCDGAHSRVRKALGHVLRGEAARQLWGVMDVLAVTDFPDFRLKCAIQSAASGSLLLIPREGGFLVRMYIELDELRGEERANDRGVAPDVLIARASAVLAPYKLDVRQVAWWSAYEIGQRVCDSFDDVPDAERETRTPRIFIAGDACHTHSPKAGQGMNVSMADAFNLGWKLASVLRGEAGPELLHTYSGERHAKARELIAFDRDMARLFSARDGGGAAATEFQRYFAKHARYTAGVETRYDVSVIRGPDTYQALARGLPVGMRFHSAPVIRLADAKPMHLGHTVKADGRWRIFLFAGKGDAGQPGADIAALCRYLCEHPASPLRPGLLDGRDLDTAIDVRAIFQHHHRELDMTTMPALLLPAKGCLGLKDYEKVFCSDMARGDIFDLRGIDRASGAMVVVRPDQYVAHVLPLGAHEALSRFFGTTMRGGACARGEPGQRRR